MNKINQKTWKRKKHFDFFKKFDYPQFSICANVDFTRCLKFIKSKNLSVFKCILFSVMKSANGIEEFRYRIRGREIISHKKIDAGITIFREDELYSNSIVKYSDDVRKFFNNTQKAIDKGKKRIIVNEEQKGKDNLVYITCLPWISFTSVMHPIKLGVSYSIPRISWGKFFHENNQVKLPVSVQANHCLVDGIQAAKFYEQLQNILDTPEKFFL